MSKPHTAKIILSVLVGAALATAQTQGGGTSTKPRVIVTADPELDDSNSMVRFLLYSTDYRVEGLIYASSQFHWKGDEKGTKWYVAGREYSRNGLNLCPCTSWRWAPNERFIHNAVEAYEKVYPNLKVHSPDYPAPEYLKSVIRYGNIEFDGEMSKDTPGSELIKQRILDDKEGPLYITAWGGASTIARALKSIQDQYEGTLEWAPLQEKISKKVVLLFSGDQDNTDARYIRPNWPNIPHGISGGWRGVPLAYAAQRSLLPEDAEYYSPKWEQENISSKGLLGAFWRVWGDGKQMVEGDTFDYFGLSGFTSEQLRANGYNVWLAPGEKGSFLAEGDSGTFLALQDTGLRFTVNRATAPASGFGGIGAAPGAGVGTAGRSGRGGAAAAAAPSAAGGMMGIAMGRGATPRPLNPDFVPALWNDFATRMKWSVTPNFKDANHKPTVKLEGPLDLTVKPGDTVKLSASTWDPDDNTVSVKWWQHKSAGTYPGEISLSNPNPLIANFTVPADAEAGATIHVIVEATDNGTPPLRHYQEVVITIAK